MFHDCADMFNKMFQWLMTATPGKAIKPPMKTFFAICGICIIG